MNDRKTVLAVIGFLGAFALVGLAATALLLYAGTDASSVAILSGMTGSALGGLTGLLASTRSTTDGPSLADVITSHDQGAPS